MQLSHDIVVINRYFRQKRKAYLEPFGLKGFHARYLIEISRNPGISQDQLAQKLSIDKSNVARQVVFLEEQGYLRRQPSSTDKRVMQLYPTQKATDLAQPLEDETKNWERQLTRVLTQDQLQQLESLLQKLRTAAEEGDCVL